MNHEILTIKNHNPFTPGIYIILYFTDPWGFPEYSLSEEELIFPNHEIARGVRQVKFKRGYFVGPNREV